MSQKTERLENLRLETQLKRWERRREMIGLYSEGYRFSDFADQVAEKYNLNVKALGRDWDRRKHWLPILAKVDDPKLQVSKIVMRMRRIAEAAWQTYRSARKANNQNAMVGAVEKLIRVSQHEVDIMQSLGILSKEPEKIDALITQAGPMPWQEIPEVKAAVEAIRKKMREEREAEKAVQAS